MRTIFRLSLYLFLTLLIALPLLGLGLESTGIGTQYLPQPWIDLLHYEWQSNTISLWLRAVLTALVTGLLLHIADTWLETRLDNTKHPKQHHALYLLNLLARRTSSLFIALVAMGAGAELLKMPPDIAQVVGRAVHLIVLLQTGLWVSALAAESINAYVRRRATNNPALASALTLMHMASRCVVWAVVGIAALDTLGFNVTALLAGLGIGGAAIALALQKTLSDVFSSVGLILDKPFGVGDFIILGDQRGTVEEIGVKTTRIRSQTGEQIIIPNGDMLQARIHNYKRMEERRVAQRFNLWYETNSATLETIPAMLKEIVTAQKNVRFDRAVFDTFGVQALEFEMVYFVLSSSYADYAETKQRINFAILKRFEEAEIHFAYPVLAPPLKVNSNNN